MPSRKIRGLVTVAVLKAHFDEGQDHLAMFLPFLVDALGTFPRDDFEISEIQKQIVAHHGIQIPLAPLGSVLKRAAKLGYVNRTAGRFIRQPLVFDAPPLEEKRAKAEKRNAELGRDFQVYCKGKGIELNSPEEGLDRILSFLEENDLAVTLDPSALEELVSQKSEYRLAARYLRSVVRDRGPFLPLLRDLCQGFALQSCLLLPDIGAATRRFRDLTVFLDSKLVIQCLGLEGAEAQEAGLESLELLRHAGARVAVFQASVDEIRRVLAVIGRLLATAEGRRQLRQTALARYLLTNRFSPGDVVQQSAVLEQKLASLQIQIKQFPRRKKAFVRDERALALLLKRDNENETEPRIVHDVDAIAAVFTIRGGRNPSHLDQATAIFSTANTLLVETVEQWCSDHGETSFPPIIYHVELTKRAWVMKPSAFSELKLRELAALCSAALRPSQATWERFKRHLTDLQASGDLNSDEAVAVLVSSFADEYLSEREDYGEPAEDSYEQIIERIKEQYRKEAAEAIKAKNRSVAGALDDLQQKLASESIAAAEARREAEERIREAAAIARGSYTRIDNFAARVASVASRLVSIAASLALGLVLFLLLLPLDADRNGGWRWIPALVLAVLTYLNLTSGFFFASWVEKLRERTEMRARMWLVKESPAPHELGDYPLSKDDGSQTR